MKRKKLLKHYFGHTSFRPFQEEAIDALLAKRDLLMILPTGGGKSLCYQLPTLLMEGVTVVISPLLALMHDQVVALQANGMRAEMLSSLQTPDEIKQIEQALLQGELSFLYLSPERIAQHAFLHLLSKVEINFFVVDEAHCLSEWGHEFREHYRSLGELKASFPHIPIAAFTATATPKVKEDILHHLGLREPLVLKGSLFRENVTIQVAYRTKDGRHQLRDFLKAHPKEAGIVYTLSRQSTERIATFLQKEGFLAKPYHAGLSSEERQETYGNFVSDRIDIVVATIAFGMGIDKSNIRFIVHMMLPKTLENFYQEIGRAGRDGSRAETLLLFGLQDKVQQLHFIERLPQSPYRLYAQEKLEKMVDFANSPRCRHQMIAEYFFEEMAPCENGCDNCLSQTEEREEITIAVQKLLSAVLRTEQKYGLDYVIDVLRGSRQKRIIENQAQSLSVYGIGEEHSKEVWLRIAQKLLGLHILALGAYQVCYVTEKGRGFLTGKEPLFMKKSELTPLVTSSLPSPHYLESYNELLYEKLRQKRKEIAQEEGIPPYIIFSDKTLKQLSQKRPQTKEEMLQIHGIAEVKFQRYGTLFLTILQERGESV